MSQTPTESAPKPRPQRNRRWVWFFLFLLGLGVVVGTVMIGYYWSQQLTGDQLETALQKWQEHGPKTYELHYSVKSGTARSDEFKVRVLDGVVVSVTLNGLSVDPDNWENHSMTALLRDIKQFMKLDAQPGKPWTDTRALFNEHDGHLLWFKRSVKWQRERVQIEVKLFRSL